MVHLIQKRHKQNDTAATRTNKKAELLRAGGISQSSDNIGQLSSQDRIKYM